MLIHTLMHVYGIHACVPIVYVVHRKRYVNPYDREVTSIQQSEELAAAMTVNNSSMSAR